MKKSLYFVILMLVTCNVNAQVINLEFPYFAGKTYDFIIFQGEKQITLVKDTIPVGGKVRLSMPEQYAGYKGMAQWYLTNSVTGGGLDLIINNENFSVSCLDSIPTNENIIYKNTAEYVFNNKNYKEQQIMLEKYDAMFAAVRAYPKDYKYYGIFESEYKSLKNRYAVLNNELAESSLYAAKFRQIVNFTMGIGTILTDHEQEKTNNFNDFFVNQMDFEVLYTSNHWGGLINTWVQLNTMSLKDDTKFYDNIKTILKRINNDKVYTDFVNSLSKELTKVGKDALLFALSPEIKNSKRLLNYEGVLSIFQQDLSGKAPDLIIPNSNYPNIKKQKRAVLTTDKLKSKYTLLLFYKSDCGYCEETIKSLKEQYKDLVTKGFRILSFSADTDSTVFLTTSSLISWPENYCDYEGIKGVNFKNYAVIGTPTMYVLDENGMIIKRISTVEELITWNKLK